jgi:hypothetical protein
MLPNWLLGHLARLGGCVPWALSDLSRPLVIPDSCRPLKYFIMPVMNKLP